MTGPMPEILSHPNIPKQLHGMNPRTLMGADWWRETRNKVYAKYGQTCAACGVSKDSAKKHKWLEAHENFRVDYAKKTARIVSIEPLCHYCHAFIHSGLLRVRVAKGDVSRGEAKEILSDGVGVLRSIDGSLFPGTAGLCECLGVDVSGVKVSEVPKSGSWGGWRMLWGDREWPSPYPTFDHWQRKYRRAA